MLLLDDVLTFQADRKLVQIGIGFGAVENLFVNKLSLGWFEAGFGFDSTGFYIDVSGSGPEIQIACKIR